MRENFFSVLVGVAFLSVSAFAKSGATTIGDGGHVVICNNEARTGSAKGMLLDLFEGQAFGYEVRLNFGDASSLSDKVSFGLERIHSRLNLSSEEFRKMQSWSRQINQFSYDPWKSGYVFKARDPLVKRVVYDELSRNSCYLDTVVIHPDSRSKYDNKLVYESLCAANGKTVENCFLVNSRYIKNMSTDEKSCLVLHEVLRFLLLTGKIADEATLRRNTFFACTGV